MEPRITIQRRDLFGSSIQTSDPIWFPQELRNSVTNYLNKLKKQQEEENNQTASSTPAATADTPPPHNSDNQKNEPVVNHKNI